MKKGIITIHGMGEQTSGYSKEFEVMLSKEFDSMKQKDDILVFKEVEWSSILSTNEDKLISRNLVVKSDVEPGLGADSVVVDTCNCKYPSM